jgi:hypothetical protein
VKGPGTDGVREGFKWNPQVKLRAGPASGPGDTCGHSLFRQWEAQKVSGSCPPGLVSTNSLSCWWVDWQGGMENGG